MKDQMQERRANLILALGVLLAFLALALTLWMEFGRWHNYALQVDEMHFSACAARASATGQYPNAGCHDNKAPMIYNVHQLVYEMVGGYSAPAIKLVAYLCVAAMLGLTAVIAHRCGGWPAVWFGVTPLLCVLMQGSNLHALKTETLGMVLVLGAILVLSPRSGRLSSSRFIGAGLLIGLSILTKQTYVLLLPFIGVWLILTEFTEANWLKRASRALPGLVICSVAALACIVGAYATFAWSGNAETALASFFLYPTVYANGPPSSVRELILRLEAIARLGIYRHQAFALLFLLALSRLTWRREAAQANTAGSPSATHRLVLCMSLPLVAPLLLSPQLFDYHLIPAWVIMAPVVGTYVAELWRTTLPSGQSGKQTAIAIGLCALGLLTIGQVWRSNAGRGDLPPEQAGPLEEGRGRFGYLLGMPTPEFYFMNGLIPASDIMYPWALPSMQAASHYTPPSGRGWRANFIKDQQERNLRRLFEDFSRTPPAHIAVLNEPEWKLPDSRISAVPGIDTYIKARCQYHYTQPLKSEQVLHMYRCNAAQAP